MKKLAVLFVLVAAIGTSVAVSSAAGSGTPTVVKGFLCNTFNADGSSFNQTTQSTDTLYSGGKETLHCIGQDPSGGDGTVHVFSGFACNLLNSYSTDPANNDRVSKTGESQLWCYGNTGGGPARGSAGAA